jgi:hypothetical protein
VSALCETFMCLLILTILFHLHQTCLFPPSILPPCVRDPSIQLYQCPKPVRRRVSLLRCWHRRSFVRRRELEDFDIAMSLWQSHLQIFYGGQLYLHHRVDVAVLIVIYRFLDWDPRYDLRPSFLSSGCASSCNFIVAGLRSDRDSIS